MNPLALLHFAISIPLILLEYVYSIKRGDNVYEKKELPISFVSALILYTISSVATLFAYSILFFIYFKLGHTPTATFSPLYFLICFLLFDFMYYLFHRIHHANQALWAIHSVHHGHHNYNLTTYFRESWLHLFYIHVLKLPLFIAGFNPYHILLSSQILFIYQFYCHSQYLKIPRSLEKIIITPSLHKIHHDNSIQNQTSNFGGVLSIWDKIFGTYVGQLSSFRPGIKNYKQEHLLKIQTDPIIFYVKKTFTKNKIS